MKRTIYACTAVVLCITLLTGCWSRRELNEIGIVLAVAIEKDAATGGIILTAQIVRPAALKKESGGGTAKKPTELVTTKGNTIFEAIRNMSKEFDRRPFFSHTKVLVIDEQLARDGVNPIIHFWLNSVEIRPVLWFFIARGVPAREIISGEHGIEEMQATFLTSVIKNEALHSEATAVNLLDFLSSLAGNITSPIAGVLEVTQEFPLSKKETDSSTGIKLAGTAVFKKDKLIGYLNEKETRGLNWITGKVTSGAIQIPSPKGGLLSFEIKNAASRIKPEIKDGKYIFTIEVTEDADLVEKQQRIDVNNLAVLNELNQAQQKVIEDEIKQTVDKVQKEYASDVLGFGKALYDAYPDEWETIKDNWPELFPEVEYTVKVETKIRKTGLMQKPIMPKEGPEPEIKSKGRPYDFLKTEE